MNLLAGVCRPSFFSQDQRLVMCEVAYVSATHVGFGVNQKSDLNVVIEGSTSRGTTVMAAKSQGVPGNHPCTFYYGILNGHTIGPLAYFVSLQLKLEMKPLVFNKRFWKVTFVHASKGRFVLLT